MPALSLPGRLRNAIKPLVPPAVWSYVRRSTEHLIDDVFDPYRRTAYSQDGEDLLLHGLLGAKARGYYVDIGAFHPRKFSNTYLFYKQGWNGINIDATPGSMAEFRRVRPRDTNLEMAISDVEETMLIHVYSNPVFNSVERARPPETEFATLDYLGTQAVRSMRLETLMERYLPKCQTIDFLSVDVEGHEINVLRSNDWVRFRPLYLCVEELGSSLTLGCCRFRRKPATYSELMSAIVPI